MDKGKIKNLLVLIVLLFLIATAYAEEKPRVAVSNLQAQGISQMESNQISDFLRNSLSNYDALIVLNRTNMEEILAEQVFQYERCSDRDCAVKLGKILGVEKMIVGTAGSFAGEFYIDVSYVDVETTKIEFSEYINFKELRDAKQMGDTLSGKIINRIEGKVEMSQPPIVHGIVEKTEKKEVTPKEKQIKRPFTFRAGWRSMLLPGLGQIYNGEKEKGKKMILY